MLYASSKSDISRLEELHRCTGRGVESPEAGARLLELTNRIWRTNTIPSRFFSDSMVATWLDNHVLHRDVPDLFAEENQYSFLGWYCCARLLESGCSISRELVDPIVERMAREPVAESPNSRLPYSALMMSVYHYRTDVRDAVSFLTETPHASFLSWYYCHGIRELGLVHHVSAEERAVLNGGADSVGHDGISPLCRFALEWMPHPEFDLSSVEDRAKARVWFFRSACEMQPFATLVEGDEQAKAAQTAAPVGIGEAHSSPAVQDRSEINLKYRVKWQTPRYFDLRGDGLDLLLLGEWFPAEPTFTWSKAPWASLAFRLPEPIDAGFIPLGLLLHPAEDVALQPDRQLTIYVNGSRIWNGRVREAAGSELVLQVRAEDFRADGLNLLQFHVSEPFVPAELVASNDVRRLGIALRRLWVGKPRRQPQAADIGSASRFNTVRTSRNAEKLLVLRGDLRSHTGYGKATRAFAGLVPEEFRIIGVDIHPDPADNQAAVPFTILPEAEALEQVAEHATRCVVAHCTSPDDFAVWPNARNVGWFFWETDTVPYLRGWPLRLNLMDAIWAPTSFMAGFVRAADYRGPVHAVAWPDGFADAREQPVDSAKQVSAHYFADLGDLRHPARLRQLSELRSEARLLFVGVQSVAPRKGLPLLLSEWRSHVQAANATDILVLRLAFRHATGLSSDWQEFFLDALSTAGFRRGAPVRIAVVPQAISEAALSGLYRTADAFVSMTYGEGFGGPILEAIQHGCPVIAPRHTGLCDLLPENYPLAVANRRLCVALKGNLPSYPHSSSWYIPEGGSMSAKLAEFSMMPAAARQALVQECRKHAMTWCWTPVVRQKLAAALDALELDAPADAAGGRAIAEQPAPGLVVEVEHAAD